MVLVVAGIAATAAAADVDRETGLAEIVRDAARRRRAAVAVIIDQHRMQILGLLGRAVGG